MCLDLKCMESSSELALTMLITTLLILVLLILVVLGWRNVSFCHGKFGGHLPGPKAWPLIGNLPDLFHPDLPAHLLELAQKYGPIYRLRFGMKDMVVLNSSELIREALIRKWSHFAGRPHSFIANLVSFGGKDLAYGNYTPTWRMQKKMTNFAFQRCLHGNMEQIVQSQARCLSKIFQDYGGEPVDVALDFSLQTSQVISAVVFGPLDISIAREISQCIIELINTWNATSIQILDFLPILRVFPNTTLRNLLSYVDSRNVFVQDQMKKHKESHRPPEIWTLLDHMLQFLKEHGDGKQGEACLSPEHVHMAIVDLFIAGTETTAALLTWAIAFFCHYPQIQERIHEELMTVIGRSRDPTYKDREHLPYLNATISELLRMRPSAPLAVPHMAMCDTSLSGFRIRKGTTVIPNLYGAHHDASKWHHPTEFRPERFLEGNALQEAQKHLLPFSCGVRLCLGETLARMEVFYFLAHILRDFQILPPVNGCLPDLKGQFGIVVHCKSFMVRLVPRVA